MENLTGPIIGLMFLQRNHTVLDMRQGIFNLPFFSMQLETADHRNSNVLEPILNPTEITIPPNDRVLIRTNPLLYPENTVSGILQPSDPLHEEGDITFCPASAIYRFLWTTSQITPTNSRKNSIFILPVSLSWCQNKWSTSNRLIRHQERAAHYVSSLIKTNKNSQNTENSWFPTSENPSNPQEHTPIEKRILRLYRPYRALRLKNRSKMSNSWQNF